MRLRIFLGAALLFMNAVAGAQTAPSVKIEEVSGDLFCTALARQVPLQLLLEEIGAQAGLTVEGLDRIADVDRVTVHLLRRPLDQAIHRILGAAGLRGRISSERIQVQVDVPLQPSSEEFADLAEVAYLRTLRDHPDDPRAAEMEFAMAGIQEDRGHLGAARGTFDYLVEKHPDSDLVPLALLRSGLLLQELGAWADAATKFTELANLAEPHAHEARARLELARCATELERYRPALLMLDALDRHYPEPTLQERSDRLLLRAHAANGDGQPLEALRCVARIAALDPGPHMRVQIMRERGRALELTNHADRAASAWLALASGMEGGARAEALVEATRLALAAGDELGATFIAAHATDLGHGPAVAQLATEARTRLGLDPQLKDRTPRQKLAQAERSLQRGAVREAKGLLDPLFRRRIALDAATARAVAIAWARSLELEGDLDGAISVLRLIASETEDDTARRGFYLLAAQLYEKHGRFHEAADAYGGTL